MAKRKFKMRGGGLGGAPVEGGTNTLLLIVLIAVLGFIAYQIYKLNSTPVQVGGSQVIVNGGLGLPNVLAGVFGGGGSGGQGDDRYSQAPKPMRMWRAPPDTSVWNPTTLPSVATRGLPESFQTIGLLQYPGGDLKPLYGRRTAGSNDRWNYYTRTDTYNPVPLPLSQGRRDCMDDTGCNEVFDGDNLKSMGGEQVKVKLYKMNGPTYIPSV
jgi:hypothetical protein